MNDIDWIKPGAKAVILRTDGRRALSIRTVTVERVLKRDVVLDNGDRFRLKDHHGSRLVERTSDIWDRNTTELVHPNEPDVASARLDIAARNLRTKCADAYAEWKAGRTLPETVVAAFQELADFERTR